jgi:hypothetical protein
VIGFLAVCFATVMQNLFRHQLLIVVASGDCVALPND